MYYNHLQFDSFCVKSGGFEGGIAGCDGVESERIVMDWDEKPVCRI